MRAGEQESRRAGEQDSRRAGEQESRRAGGQESRRAGTLPHLHGVGMDRDSPGHGRRRPILAPPT